MERLSRSLVPTREGRALIRDANTRNLRSLDTTTLQDSFHCQYHLLEDQFGIRFKNSFLVHFARHHLHTAINLLHLLIINRGLNRINEGISVETERVRELQQQKWLGS